MNILRQHIGYKALLPRQKPSKNSRREQLIEIIKHANQTTPFYKKKFDTFLKNEPEFSEEEFFYAFSHLPIAEKDDLKTRNSDFMSDHLKDKPDLLQDMDDLSALQMLKTMAIKKDFMTTLSTGGTSGTPTYRWLDYDDAQIFAHSFLDSFKRNGWKTGESFVVFYPLKSYFTDTYAQHSKTLHNLLGFTMVPFETITKDKVIELLDTLRKTNATLLVIFPCVLQRIAEIMHAEDISPFENLPCINVSGEFFMDCSKHFIQTLFPDSDIQSTYGAVEFGEIAHQSGLSSLDYDVFDDYVYVEQGPKSSILVTALHQKAFPLIRYKIEDMGRIKTKDNGKQKIESLEGKNTDYLVGADDYIYFTSFFNHLINEINKETDNTIIHFMLRHDKNFMQINCVLLDQEKQEPIAHAILETMKKAFSNYERIEVNFPPHFEHDYTRKFKIIGEGDGLTEVVGGYHRKAS